MADPGVICVVQARVGSTRLPGKVLADVGGRPLLGFLLARLAPLGLDRLVVATSDRPGDDAVAEVARDAAVAVVRGPEDDVLARFAMALDARPADAVVRLTGDCPLADPALVDEAVAVWASSGADYVSNTLVRTFPDGLDVEVVSAGALRAAAAEAGDAVEREHVTPFVHRRPSRFTLRSFRHDEPLGHLRWTVDTADDLAFVASVVGRLGGRTDFSWREVLALTAPADGAGTGAGGFALVPAGPADEGFVLALRNDPDSVRWSLDARPVGAGRHAAWFASVLENPGTRLWVAREGGEPVGQVRVDVDDGVGSVSIAVTPAARGRGVATHMLDALTAALGADEQVHTLTAVVHEDNEPSRRLFTSAGFEVAGHHGAFLTVSRSRR